jgi:hypothetical protein
LVSLLATDERYLKAERMLRKMPVAVEKLRISFLLGKITVD